MHIALEQQNPIDCYCSVKFIWAEKMATVSVNPEILRWARETAGLQPEVAVKKINLPDTKAMSAVERLTALESGDANPTRALLVRMAKQYRRPLLTFYLSNIPPKGDRGNDYRTLPDGRDPQDDAILDALIRNIRVRQSVLRAALQDEEEAESLSFIGSMRMEDGVQAVLESIRGTIPLTIDHFRQEPTSDSAFGRLRRAVESVGIYVILAGNLGSHHTSIDVHTFRGFALSDPVAPFVIINDQDARAAWSFTLLHELTHLWLGQTGVSGTYAELAIEQFCNDVASEYLLPETELQQLHQSDVDDVDSLIDLVTAFANERNVSRTMVVLKLYRSSLISREMWQRASEQFRSEWIAARDARRLSARTQEGGPTYYIMRRHRIGNALIDTVNRMMLAGALTTTKAGTVLGVKPKNVAPLMRMGNSASAA